MTHKHNKVKIPEKGKREYCGSVVVGVKLLLSLPEFFFPFYASHVHLIVVYCTFAIT